MFSSVLFFLEPTIQHYTVTMSLRVMLEYQRYVRVDVPTLLS